MIEEFLPVSTDKIFAALGEPTRMKIVELLHQENSTLLELSSHFSMSFQALSKHIKILEEAQVLSKKRKGKYRILSLNRTAFESALKWISYYSDFWAGSFDRLQLLINQNADEN